MLKRDYSPAQLGNNIHFIFLFLLGCRLAFIFSNATTSNNNLSSLRPEEIQQSWTKEEVAKRKVDLKSPSKGDLEGLHTASTITEETQTPSEQIVGKIQNNADLSEDIAILETAYKKEKDMKIAKTLIEKLAQNYEFEKANTYLQALIMDPNYDQSIEATLHLYIAIHDPTIVSITDPQSIQRIIPIMDEYKHEGRLSTDDYNFYQGLIKLRYKDFKGARELFNGVTIPRYAQAIQSITQAISKYDSTKAIPRYYQEALVALSLLKNGYFSIAKKLALDTALEDNKYILPYQILAYTQFLTNNREAANDYFLKLADVDISNKDLYKFLIGISFYRSKEYEQAILYLSQVNNPTLQTDTYRYLILAYHAENDTKSMTQTRQKLLGQTDLPAEESIAESDYYDYFYQTFYKPYSINEPSKIYEENKLLGEMYLNSCTSTFTGDKADICTYGKIGLELTKNKNLSTLQALDIGLLTNLADTYNESYFFSLIGDIYTQQNNFPEAKKDYAKALSLSVDSTEQGILQTKINSLPQ